MTDEEIILVNRRIREVLDKLVPVTEMSNTSLVAATRQIIREAIYAFIKTA